MVRRPPIRCHQSHPRLFEALESRILLDGDYFDWDSLSDMFTVDVPAIDTQPATQPDTQPGDEWGSESNNSATDTSTDMTDTSQETPESYPPGRPTHLALQALSNTSILISWQFNSNDADGFYITRRGPGGGIVAQLPATARNYTDVGLLPGTRYSYIVTAYNGDGQTDSAKASIGTLGDHLTVTAQPGPIKAGTGFGITVALQDADNHTDTAANSTLSAALASGPAGTALAGPLSVQVAGGVATFSGLSLTVAGSYQLAVTDGISTTLTKAFTVTADAASARLVLLQQPPTGAIGKGLGLRVAVDDAFGNLVTTDKSKVTLSLAGGPEDGALTGTLTATVQQGIATFNHAALSRAGTFTLSAGDASLPAGVPLQFTQQIIKATTAIPAPGIRSGGYVFGSAIMLSTTFKSSAAVAFTGEASLMAQDGTVLATSPLTAGGTARFTLDLVPGTYAATIQYGGDANHTAAASRAFSFKVTPAPTTIALAASATRLALGQGLTLTASVAAAPTAARTGTVTFMDGNVVVGTVALDADDRASLTLAGPGVGTHTYTAVYSGDGLYRGGRSKSLQVAVTRAPTAVALSVPDAHVALGVPVTLTIQVAALTSATLTPAGKVIIRESGRTLATLTLSGGAANWSYTPLKAGSHVLTETYLGDGNDLASVSLPLTLTVV